MFSKAHYVRVVEAKDYVERDNTLPNNKILDWSKFKAFADDKIIIAEMMISPTGGVENIVGKGESAGYQHFLLFQIMFSKAFFFRAI